jgi:hypothetical protein
VDQQAEPWDVRVDALFWWATAIRADGSSGGLTALPRPHPSMTATWQPSRRGRRVRTDKLEASGHLRSGEK